MGSNSPIVHSHRLLSVYGYYCIAGSIVNLYRNINPIALHNISINKNPRYLEFFPLNNNTAYSILIMPVSSIVSFEQLYNEFKISLRSNDYCDIVDSNSLSNKLHGIITVGKLKATALNRILFFGEASQIQPAISATAVHNILMNLDKITYTINSLLEKDNLSAKSLYNVYYSNSRFNRNLQRKLFKKLITLNSYEFKKMLASLSTLPEGTLESLIFADIDLVFLLKNSSLGSLIFNPLIRSALRSAITIDV